jgi:hypothetical protein
MKQITKENWKINRFKTANKICFISLGADLDSSNDLKYLYSVITSDLEYVEISEQVFDSIDQALHYINENYSHWELFSLSTPVSEDGCSSCVAH